MQNSRPEVLPCASSISLIKLTSNSLREKICKVRELNQGFHRNLAKQVSRDTRTRLCQKLHLSTQHSEY